MINKILDIVNKPRHGNFKELLPIDVIGEGYVLMKNGYIQTGIKVQWPSLFSLYEEELKDIIRQVSAFMLTADAGIQISFQNAFVPSKGNYIEPFSNLLDKSQLKNQDDDKLTHFSYIFIGYSNSYNPSDFVIYDEDGLKRNKKKSSSSAVNQIPIEKYLISTNRLARSIQDTGLVKCSIMNGDNISDYMKAYLSLNWKNPTAQTVSEKSSSLSVGNKTLSTISLNKNPEVSFNHFKYPKFTTDFTKINNLAASTLPSSFVHSINLGLACPHITTLSFVLQDDKKFVAKVNKHFKNIQGIASVFDDNKDKAEITKAFVNSTKENSQDRIVAASLNTMVISESDDEHKSNMELAERAYEDIGLKPITENYLNLEYYRSNLLGNAFSIPRLLISSVSRINKLFPFETNGILSDKGMVVQNKAGYTYLLDLVSKITQLGNKVVRKTNYNMTLFGKTGSGKSNLLAYIILYVINLGAHVTIIDKGNSFKKLYLYLKKKIRCKFYTWEVDNPLAFNPFLLSKKDGKYLLKDHDELPYLIQLMVEVVREKFEASELGLVSDLISDYMIPLYYDRVNHGTIKIVGFDSFYEFLRSYYKELHSDKSLDDDDLLIKNNFDFEKVLIAYKKFYKGGRYASLFNSKENYNIEKDQLVLFELNEIQKDPFLFRIVSICITQIQDAKLASKLLHNILKYLIIDEGTFMMNKTFGEVITAYFQTVRKHLGGMIFTDQTIDKLHDTGFANRVFGNSDTNVLLEQKSTKMTKEYIRDYLEFTSSSFRKLEAIDNNGPWREGVVSMGGVVENFRLTLSEEYLLALNTDPDNMANMRLLDLFKEYANMELAIKEVMEEQEEDLTKI